MNERTKQGPTRWLILLAVLVGFALCGLLLTDAARATSPCPVIGERWTLELQSVTVKDTGEPAPPAQERRWLPEVEMRASRYHWVAFDNAALYFELE